jgi:zinc-finger binding domain of transposase IS66
VHLPREVRRITPQQNACPDCGGVLKPLGKDVSEMLDYFPACFQMIQQFDRSGLCALRQNHASRSTEPSDRAGPAGSGTSGPGVEDQSERKPSLEDGIEETLTLQRLGVGARRFLLSNHRL